MEVYDPRFQHLLELMNDYDEFIWSEPQLRTVLLDFVAKAIVTQTDVTDDEIFRFEKLLKEKIEIFVKEKGN